MATSEAVPTGPIVLLPAKKSLVSKLAEVMGEVGRVAKNGRNNFHGYDYATEADISDSVRGGLAARGIMIVPSVEKTEWEKIPVKGGEQKLCTLTVCFTVMDGESGESFKLTVIGQGADNSDKATYKAMTGAEKYMLLKLFMIPTGDDPERDDHQHQASGSRSVKPQASARQATGHGQAVTQPAAPPLPSPEAVKLAQQRIEDAEAAKALAARKTRVYQAATGKGMDVKAFQAWTTAALGGAKPSKDWTLPEVEKLEKEIAAFEPDVPF